MTKLVTTIVIATIMSLGMAAAGQARQVRSHVPSDGVAQTRSVPHRDFQAMAPDSGSGLSAGQQDPLDYRLGYFRNF